MYCGSVYSRIELVKTFIDEILLELSSVIDDENVLFDIRLILNELIINGVFHGNKCEETKCVEIDIEVDSERVKIQVTDEGDGIDFDLETYDPSKLKYSGRGLIIVDGLSDELIIEENSIVAIKSI